MGPPTVVIEQTVVQATVVPGGSATETVVTAAAVVEETTVLQVGIPGPAGPAGRDGSGGVTVPYQWNLTTPFPLLTIPVGSWVERIEVYVTTPFNGTGATLSVGDSSDPTDLMPASAIDPTTAGVYSTDPAAHYPSGGSMVLAITPGVGGSQGAGLVVVFLS